MTTAQQQGDANARIYTTNRRKDKILRIQDNLKAEGMTTLYMYYSTFIEMISQIII